MGVQTVGIETYEYDPDGEYHVVPINDLKEHDLSSDCWCRPGTDGDYENIYIHNSMDGREHSVEKGRLH